MDKKIIIKNISNIKKTDNEEETRLELYGIIVELILSKAEFPLNSDITQFLDELKIGYKPYLLKSRTSIIGKVIRTVEKKNIDELHFYLEVIERRMDIIENKPKKETRNEKEKKKSNYMSELMKKYRRTGNDNE